MSIKLVFYYEKPIYKITDYIEKNNYGTPIYWRSPGCKFAPGCDYACDEEFHNYIYITDYNLLLLI